MHRCAIYARFSTDHQNESSAEDQVRECRRRAEREGWNVVDVYTDLAISGANNRRPGMTALLADVAAGRFDVVMAEDLDRFARDQEDIAAIFKRVTFAGARLFSLSVGEVNELHIGFKGTMDAVELKKMAEKIRRGQRGAVERGRVPGGLCYGYRVVRQLDARGEMDRGLREVDADQAEIVRRIMREYVDGRTAIDIARDLNLEGVPSARGGQWRVSAIIGNRARMIGILHNPIYVGRLAHNRVTMKRDPDTRRRVSRPNQADEIVFRDMPHLRIVSDQLWAAVQERRASRETLPLNGHHRRRHLLSGLVRCGVCRGGYAVRAHGRLGCSSRHAGGLCNNASRIAIAELQQRVLDGLEQQLLSEEAIAILVREYRQERDRRLKEDARRQRGLVRQLKDAEAVVARLVAAIAAGGADFREVREALARATAQRDDLRARLAEDDAANVVALHPRVADAYRQKVRDLITGLGTGEITETSSAGRIRALVEAVYVTPAASGGCDLEVIGSLQAAIALATGSSRRGSRPMLSAVAEEGLEPPTPGL
jgi:site-specific DNA recombinase